MYVLNTWYVAAWSAEVSRTPTRRVVCEVPIGQDAGLAKARKVLARLLAAEGHLRGAVSA